MVVLDFAILFFPAFYLVLFLTRFGSSKWPLRGALVLFSLLTISSGVLAVYQGASLTYPTYGGVTNLEIIGNPILSPGTASTKTSRGTASFGINIANYHSSDTGFSISLFGPVPKNDSNSLFGNISTVSSSYPRLQIYQCRDQSHCFTVNFDSSSFIVRSYTERFYDSGLYEFYLGSPVLPNQSFLWIVNCTEGTFMAGVNGNLGAVG